jgi:hypothetical protein
VRAAPARSPRTAGPSRGDRAAPRAHGQRRLVRDRRAQAESGVFASFDALWTGATTLGFKEIKGAGGAGEVAVQNASLVASQKDQGATVNVGVAFKVGALRWAGDGPQPRTASNIAWEVELDQLDKQAIVKYSKTVGELQTRGLSPLQLAEAVRAR